MGQSIIELLKSLDYSPLFISLKTGIVATIICFIFGILTAGWVMGRKSGVRGVIDSILTLPMVIPPTATGFFLLLLFSKRRPVGMYLYDH